MKLIIFLRSNSISKGNQYPYPTLVAERKTLFCLPPRYLRPWTSHLTGAFGHGHIRHEVHRENKASKYYIPH